MFHTWQSSSTGLILFSVLQRFGYTGNVNLNRKDFSQVANGLLELGVSSLKESNRDPGSSEFRPSETFFSYVS